MHFLCRHPCVWMSDSPCTPVLRHAGRGLWLWRVSAREGAARVAQGQALIRWDGHTEDIVMELGVEGNSQEAAWILPVPAQVTVKRRACPGNNEVRR